MNLKNKKFPFGIYCGKLIDNDKNSFPFLLTEYSGGFCVLFDENFEEEANSFIENVMFKLLEVISYDNIEIDVFDYSISQRFKYLANLSHQGIYKILNKSQLSNNKFTELEDLAFKRHHELLTPDTPTISVYNEESKFLEKYHVLVINMEDFPDDLTSERRFRELVNAASKAGIYMVAFGLKNEILHSSKKSHKLLLKQLPTIEICNDKVLLKEHKDIQELNKLINQYDMKIELIDDDLKILSENIVNSLQENYDFEEKDFLSIPIGTTPDGRNIINFSLGKKSDSYNAFITGMSGTGKTTLLNNIILHIAEKYTSNEIQLYLMDYKEGVEFQVFKEHPNCRKIFLDNEDLAAATTLLEEFVEMTKIRGNLFKQQHVSDIDEYNNLNDIDHIPRMILIIDEVHRLFTGSWGKKEKFTKLLEDISRRGRSFGIHFILSTQTLAGIEISHQTMEQIPTRISYKLNSERASEKILTYGNNAPLTLNKYELIYNNNSGVKDANRTCRANIPRDIYEVIANLRATRESSLCLTPEEVRSTPKELISENENKVEEKVWQFNPVDEGTIKYGTSADKELMKKLKAKGIVPEKIEEV